MATQQLKLLKIPVSEIEAHPDHYNSNFHTALEAPGLPIPTDAPQHHSRFLPLISKSQSIPLSEIQILTLNPAEATVLLSAAKSSLHTRELNRLLTEELQDLERTSSLSSLRFPAQGLFLRLDASSPKDGVCGSSPLRSAAEVVLRLTTSHRAVNAITRLLDAGEDEVRLYFLPWDGRMDTRKEFRVFCAPGDRVTGVSQYRWYERSFLTALQSEEIAQAAERIWEGIQDVHEEILKAVKERSDKLDTIMLEQGFSFDVLWVGERCLLIELNSFGARSGCGSCLFQWLRDGDVLYGRNGGEVEFRISV